MSFRRDGKQSLLWRRWTARHRAELSRCGIPDFILTDEANWLVFVQEGGWDPVTGFKVEMLSSDQLVGLREFLLAQQHAGENVSFFIQTIDRELGGRTKRP